MKSLFATLARLGQLDPHSVQALSDVARERLRQIEEEGWSPAHDDAHPGSLAVAGAAYAINGSSVDSETPAGRKRREFWPLHIWPWDMDWWKPKTPERDLVRGAALVVAGLARLYRKGNANDASDI